MVRLFLCHSAVHSVFLLDFSACPILLIQKFHLPLPDLIHKSAIFQREPIGKEVECLAEGLGAFGDSRHASSLLTRLVLHVDQGLAGHGETVGHIARDVFLNSLRWTRRAQTNPGPPFGSSWPHLWTEGLLPSLQWKSSKRGMRSGSGAECIDNMERTDSEERRNGTERVDGVGFVGGGT